MVRSCPEERRGWQQPQCSQHCHVMPRAPCARSCSHSLQLRSPNHRICPTSRGAACCQVTLPRFFFSQHCADEINFALLKARQIFPACPWVHKKNKTTRRHFP